MQGSRIRSVTRSAVRALRTRSGIYWTVFLLVSLLYSFFLFPHWLDDASLQTLKVLVLQPGQTLHYAYLPLDSASYLETAQQPLGQLLKDAWFVDDLNAGLGSNVTIFFLGKLAHTLVPGDPLIAVALLNHALLGLTAWNMSVICRRYGVRFDRFLPLLLLNPLVLFALHTLNKEIVGLFLISAMVRASFGRHYGLLAVLIVAGLFTRNVFFAFGLLMLVRPPLFRLPFWAPLAGASVALPVLLFATGNAPFGQQFGDLTALTVHYSQQTAQAMSIAYDLMKLPFGYILAYPLVAGINFISPAFNPRYWRDYLDYVNLAQLALQASAICFGALAIAAIARMRSWRVVQLETFRFVFLFTLLTSALPFSQHRYLLPIYPFVALLALTASRDVRSPALLTGTPLLGGLGQRDR